MFAVEVYAVVRDFVFNQGKSRREAGSCFWSEPRDDFEDLPVLAAAGVPTNEACREAEARAAAAGATRSWRWTRARRLSSAIRSSGSSSACATNMSLLSYTVVKDYVRVDRARGQTCLPLAYPPGHAQADFGETAGVIGGVSAEDPWIRLRLPMARRKAP